MKCNFVLTSGLIMGSTIMGVLLTVCAHRPLSLQEQHADNANRTCTTTPPEVPTQLVFADKTVDLRRYDLRERMDRELMSFTFMHSSTLQIIKRANRYFPLVEPILKELGIPDDLKYLMTIESNLNERARSTAGAVGLWQFMASTARDYKLEVNDNIDERYNAEKATRAACAHLADLYRLHGDWMTVAAAYNAGRGRISTELAQQGAQSALDLWLNEETSRYMFRILAAKCVLENPKQYGFMLRADQLYPVIECTTDTVKTSIANLEEYARSKDITYAQLKDMNPWLRERSLNNRNGRTYIIRIPQPESLRYDPQSTKAYNKDWVTK